jgi:hypothetical protein
MSVGCQNRAMRRCSTGGRRRKEEEMAGGGNNKPENAWRNRLEESVTENNGEKITKHSCDDMENGI